MTSDEQAKAVQEVAKATGKALELVDKAASSKVVQVLDVAAAELVGMGKDFFQHVRARNRARLGQRTAEIFRERGIEPPSMDDTTPSLLLPIVESAQDESREALVELWARLMAAALDPAQRDKVRRSFIEIVKQMDPLDALVLKETRAGTQATYDATLPVRLSHIVSASSDQVEISLSNLVRIGCLDQRETHGNPRAVSPNATSRELLRLLGY